MAAIVKDKRLELRLTEAQKSLIERAAALSGRSLTDFSTEALTARARDIIQHEHVIVLENEAYEAFAAAIDSPAEPNARLAELFRRRPDWAD